jgi:hypothetical protein
MPWIGLRILSIALTTFEKCSMWYKSPDNLPRPTASVGKMIFFNSAIDGTANY